MSLRYSIYKVQTFLSLSLTAFAFYHTQFHLSRTFFKFFQIFPRDFSARCSREQLRHVSTSGSICQALFSSFCKFLPDSLFICAALKRPAYISTAVTICQALFAKTDIFFYAQSLIKKEPLSRLLILPICYPTSSIRP